MTPEEMHHQVEALFKEQTQKAFNVGWNAAVVAVAQSIENMKVFGDTAASFATYVKEFHRDES